MGYAAGVGKTYKMLEEAQELKARGVDVVIGYFEPHGRKDTIAKTEGLEMIPRKTVEYRGIALRRDGYRCHSGEASSSVPGRRISAHQCSWFRAREAVGRRADSSCTPASMF